MRNRKRLLRTGLLRSTMALLVIVAVTLLCGTAIAESSDPRVADPIDGSETTPTLITPYKLLPGSNFYTGCLGPCACPILPVGEITGTFRLTPLMPTPLFNRYSVTNINWTVIDPAGKIIHTIRGNAIYELGGEVASMQQMTLFLRIDGKKLVTFESGLGVAQSQFPDIFVQITHMINTCYGFGMTLAAGPK